MSDSIKKLPLISLRDIVVFPYTIIPLFIGREKSIESIERSIASDKEIVLAAQKDSKVTEPSPEDIFKTGTLAVVLQTLRLQDGTIKILVEGRQRVKINKYLKSQNCFFVEITKLNDQIQKGVESDALSRSLKDVFDNYVRLNKRIPPELTLSISQIGDISKLSDTLAIHLYNLKLGQKQKLLEETNPNIRLEKLYSFIQSEIEIIRVEKKIRARVKRQMEKTQKEYFLNEQITAIQKELGSRDDMRGEIKDFEEQIKNTKLSKEAYHKLKKEIRKLKFMSPMSAEAAVVKNYLDTVLSLPWNKLSTNINDINYGERILNKDHFGLDKVKERILEFLSVNALNNGEMKGSILCLFGPPGVGKTSLAKSIAKATGRKFVKISLGGIKDEAEIRGHRRTYIGSMPGKIINALKKSEISNPVILLDEIEKINSDFRGDPSAALLEVLDPEQNTNFNDHYLELDYDLSKCLFIATANTIHSIPRPLLDRMELIKIGGYLEMEKVSIALNYLIPKQLKNNGFGNSHSVKFHVNAIKELINYYTKESGVRELERLISSILRKVVHINLKKYNQDFKNNKIKINKIITSKSIKKYIGPRIFSIGKQNDISEIGIATGLAWTELGGEILNIEVVVLPGKGKLTITGKLGSVMQESAQAAMSYVRSISKFFDIKPDIYQNIDIHVHVPEGAIPKDGPSAGLCMATALTSALIKRPVNKNVAMTGEITLRGRALAIGGLKEKVLAAYKAGIKTVIIPKDNEKDLKDIPKIIKKDINFIAVKHMDKVLLNSICWNVNKKSKYEKFLNKLSNIA